MTSQAAAEELVPQHCGATSPKELGGWIQAALLMVLAIVIMFHPVVLGGKTTALSAVSCPSVMPDGAYSPKTVDRNCVQRTSDPGAQGWQTEPWLKLTGWSYLQEHNIPLWNIYSGCGMPFLANMQSQPLSPLNALAALFASNLAVDLFVLGRLLVAGLCTYFAFRMLLPVKSSALIGAVGFMFTGYMLLFLNMPELSVSVMIPALILGVEVLVQKPSIISVVLCAAAVALNLLGGMPEISFLAFAFSGLYALTRLLTIDGWVRKLRTLGLIGVAYLAGLMLAMPQVLPFLEYMRESSNRHDPVLTGLYSGLKYNIDWRRGLLSYLFPVGWSVKSYAHGFYGVALSLLAFIGVCIAGWRLIKVRSERTTCLMMLFFGASFTVLLLKRFGSPLVQWIGTLPLANMILYGKYGEPIMALCIAALAAFGVSSIQQRAVKPRYLVALAIGFLLVIALLYHLYQGCPFDPKWDMHRDLRSNVRLGIGALLLCLALCLASFRSDRLRKLLPVLLFIPILVETYLGFLSHTYYARPGLPQRSLSAYKGAPYLAFLKKTMAPCTRVIGLDSLLYPDWSAAFNIQDVRALDAMYPARYNTFVANFLMHTESVYGQYTEPLDRFTGTEPCTYVPFHHLQRLCALMSAKYLLTMTPLAVRADLIKSQTPFAQVHSHPGAVCYASGITIDGTDQSMLFQHPRSVPSKSAVAFPIAVPRSQPILEFAFIRNPDRSSPARETKILGKVVAVPIAENLPPLEFAFTNNEHTQCHATHYKVDLSKYAGKQVMVTISSSPTKGNECNWEWVGWNNMRFPETHNERCLYDREAKIYELPDILPRAGIFSTATVVDNDRDALKLLKNPAFLPFKSVVISGGELDAGVRKQLLVMSGIAACTPAKIIRYNSDRVVIALQPIRRPTLLLLTDTYYPGWRAFVDDTECSILRANYYFRAVIIPAGAKQVIFKYDPLSFKIGIALSLLALIALSCLVLTAARRSLAKMN